MGKESTQKKLNRVRPPRVQINYDVEIGDAIETKELPFVLGVMGDFSGNSKTPLPKVKDRKFVNVDRDNFDEVMSGMAPRIATRVANTLVKDGTEFSVDLEFKQLADFEPQNVVKQIDPLNQLLEARNRLSDLRNKMIGNDKLETLIDDVLRDTEKMRAIGSSKADKK